jgi:hypothetical protein
MAMEKLIVPEKVLISNEKPKEYCKTDHDWF